MSLKNFSTSGKSGKAIFDFLNPGTIEYPGIALANFSLIDLCALLLKNQNRVHVYPHFMLSYVVRRSWV